MTERQWTTEPPTVDMGSRNRVGSSAREGRWTWFIADLKEHPGKWTYEVVNDARQASIRAIDLQRARLGGHKSGEVEAVSRTVDGEARVYARWIGEP